MVYGCCLINMSNILNDLGVDPEDFGWMDIAVCQGMDHNLLYDTYENDINIAKNIDEMQIGRAHV